MIHMDKVIERLKNELKILEKKFHKAYDPDLQDEIEVYRIVIDFIINYQKWQKIKKLNDDEGVK